MSSVQECRPKPNRSRVRHFTERDIARISRYAIDDGANPLKILVYVALVSGFAAAICQALQGLSFIGQLQSAIKGIAESVAQIAVLNFLIKKMGGQLVKWTPLAQLIVVVNALQNLMLDVDYSNADEAFQNEKVLELVSGWCSNVEDWGEEIIDYVRFE